MLNRSRFSSFAAFYLIVILSGLGSMACGSSVNNTLATNGNTAALRPSPTPTPDPCASKSDKEIVIAIYTEIDKDPDLKKQHQKIDVISTSHAVVLWGWVDDKTQHDKVVGIAKNTACVASVDASNFYDNANNPTHPIAGGCNPPLKKCGEICQIPEQCNSVGDPNPGANVNTNTTKK